MADSNVRRYFFDLCENGDYFPDREGCELSDASKAYEIAREKVRRIFRRRLREGRIPLGGYVSVRLDCGERLMFVPYSEVLAAA
ncbi:MAG: DUF6894 family protein [Allosphingosinicella sp.]|uniref:DUF6894 family protein n=1 Tax=Allosphingosinicella sp. TaxID=2823234 RepID=UPI00392B340D